MEEPASGLPPILADSGKAVCFYTPWPCSMEKPFEMFPPNGHDVEAS